MSDVGATSVRADRFVAGAVLVGIVARAVSLADDPVHRSWIGWVQDEGRWAEAARAWSLFGSLDGISSVATVHLALGPMWHAVSAAFFAVFGVGVVSARLPSLIAGSAILVLLAIGLRGRVPLWSVAMAVGLAAVDPALVYFSGVAIPEMMALLWQLSAFIVLVRHPESNRAAFFAGVLALCSLATKATTAPAVVGIFVSLVAMHRGSPHSIVRHGAAFCAPIGGAVVVAVVASSGGGRGGAVAQQLLGFIALNPVSEVLSVLYASGRGISRGDPSAVNLLLIGVWTAGMVLLPLRSRARLSESERVFRGAIVWAAAILGAWAVLDYFPDRWVVHLHLPLIVALASGSAAAAEADRDEVAEPSRFGRALLVLPAAITVAAWLVPLVSSLGVDADRVRWHVLLVLGAFGVLSAVTRFGADSSRAAMLAGWGLFALLAWRAIAGPYPWGRFWRVDDGALLGTTLTLVAAGGATPLVWSRIGGERERLTVVVRSFVVGLGVCWLGFGVARHAPGSRALADVASHLEREYTPGTMIGVDGAATVMLGTSHVYREVEATDPLPDVLVVLSGGGWAPPATTDRRADFALAMEVRLPRYERGTAEPAWVRVYERADSGTD
ncbi:MAG: hypothetical protein AAF389_07545 [Gemmatimonadota bacterium]